MSSMSHLSVLQWNVKDELQVVSQQIGGDNVPYYVYDDDSIGARKVTEDIGRKVKDWLYLATRDLAQIWRRRNLNLETETHHG